jgi:anaerobic selenocysteine-containing dehydrogenase
LPGEVTAVTKEVEAYTFCDGCNQIPKCGMVYSKVGETVTRVRSRRDFGYPNNTLCAKGYAQLQELYHPDRLSYPLKRTTPKGQSANWERISWDEALGVAADRLSKIEREHGADKVLFMTGDPKEMRAPLQRLAYSFGSPNYGTESSTCYTSIAIAGRLLFGLPLMGNPPDRSSKHCFIWGANPAYSRPVLMKTLLRSREQGVRFFVVDPRRTPTVTALEADHIPIRPGTDGALALGMMHVIFSEGLFDPEFVAKWVHGFKELKSYVGEFPPERVSAITGVPAGLMTEAARAFAEGPTTVMLSASPVVHHANGNQNVRALLSLVALTGNLDRKGGVRIPEPALLAPDFIGDAVFTKRNERLPAIRHLRADLDYYPVWAELVPEIQINLLPEYVAEGRIRGMVMFGGNARMWPQPHLYQEAMARMDFALAADIFYRPWTHDYVDLLLPAATCFERHAPPAYFGRSIYLRQPVEPITGAREDWQIIADLGVALGLSSEFFQGNLDRLLDEYLRQTGISLDQIRNAPGSMVEVDSPQAPEFNKYAQGLLRRDGKPGFETPTGKVEVFSTILERHGFEALPVYIEPEESPVSNSLLARKYPLVLITGARVPFYTHSKWRNVPWLSEFQPEPVANLNPADAASRGILEGDPVLVFNDHGSIRVKAHLTDMVGPGTVDLLHGWPDQDVNELVPRRFDPISGFPAYKAGLCQVTKDSAANPPC